MIYKIISRTLWQQAVEAGCFSGAEIDLQDGFIHFSAAHQVQETAAKHFANRDDLVLVAVDENNLENDLRWEVSRGGDRFPHLYGKLNVAHAEWTTHLKLSGDGVPVIPDLDESSNS